MTPHDLLNNAKRAVHMTARFLLCLICVLTFLPGISKVNAQAQPLMLISPNPVTFYLNGNSNQLSVNLMAENVVNMAGFEFVLSYDPSILKYVSTTPSNWLSLNSPIYSSLSNGTIHLAYAQMGGYPVNGNGTLATITFNVIGYGDSALTFSDPYYCKYANPLGNQTRFSLQHGSVTFTYNPALVSNGAIAGTFSLQGQSTNGGIPVRLDNGQYLNRGPFSGTSLNQTGSNLSINPVVMDLYTVTTNQPRYLNIDSGCGKTKAVFGTTTTLNPLKLKGGNAVWTDNVIDIHDITAITGVYGQTSTLAAPLDADINGNGTVDIFDMAMAEGNYGLSCATAYASWMP